ncbi:MAG: hypothetical protein WHT06_15435 [Desulfobacterales bacterium]
MTRSGHGFEEDRQKDPAGPSRNPAVTPEEKQLLLLPPRPVAETGRGGPRSRVSRELLVNRIHLVHFRDQVLEIEFTHRRFGSHERLAARPLPVDGRILECHWSDPEQADPLLSSHQPTALLVPRGQRRIRAEARVLSVDRQRIRVELPEEAVELNERRVDRLPGRDVAVRLLQNSGSFPGRLLDFNAFSFRVELTAVSPQSFAWIDPDQTVHAVLFRDAQTFFAGECRITRFEPGSASRRYVLEPVCRESRRFRRDEVRSQRLMLIPSPNLVFPHPLTGQRVELKVTDLSGSGFAVEEDIDRAVLLPGLILPEAKLDFAGSFEIRLSAQVVFQRVLGGEGGRGPVRCGLALIDMPPADHVRLIALLNQSRDRNAYLCKELDLEALWDFFFETGFIYPGKYALIEKRKREIRETCAKLYTRSPEIARTFLYQKAGVILGHLGMIRFWPSTWLIHHHAARKSALYRAGLNVLDQLCRFIHDGLRLRSLHMDHLACYYRPQNRFPRRVFGGFADETADRRVCSVDAFAYLTLGEAPAEEEPLPAGWELVEAGEADLLEARRFYDHASGGLMAEAFDLRPDARRDEELSELFGRLGLKRRRLLLALRRRSRLKALIAAHVSDIGLNFSELTHCLTVVGVDAEGLGEKPLHAALRSAAKRAGLEGIVALVFPETFAESAGMVVEKEYHLWVVRTFDAEQPFQKYLKRLTRTP